ncbi:MAG: ankyrin repeat domain-containing protein [Polyangiales bacterium]
MAALWAAGQGDLCGVQHWLGRGVQVDEADDDGRTALHLAAAEGHCDVARLLLRLGANPDVADRWGITPARIAPEQGHSAMTDLMLRCQRGSLLPSAPPVPMT